MADAFNVPAEGELPNFTIYQELPRELQGKEHFLEAIQILPGVIPAVHHASFGIAALRPGQKVGTGEAWPGGPIVPGALLDAKTGKSIGFVGDANEAAAGEGERVDEAVGRGRRNEVGTRFCCYVPGATSSNFARERASASPPRGTSRGACITPRSASLWWTGREWGFGSRTK